MNDFTVMSDAAVAEIRVVECGEPLVDLLDDDLVRFDARKRTDNPGATLARSGVAERLAAAQRRLPAGIRLLGIEAYRRLLASVLEPAGLVNYPTEWWHWSFGDRYWAVAEHRDHALYGPIRLGGKRGSDGNRRTLLPQ